MFERQYWKPILFLNLFQLHSMCLHFSIFSFVLSIITSLVMIWRLHHFAISLVPCHMSRIPFHIPPYMYFIHLFCLRWCRLIRFSRLFSCLWTIVFFLQLYLLSLVLSFVMSLDDCLLSPVVSLVACLVFCFVSRRSSSFSSSLTCASTKMRRFFAPVFAALS